MVDTPSNADGATALGLPGHPHILGLYNLNMPPLDTHSKPFEVTLSITLKLSAITFRFAAHNVSLKKSKTTVSVILDSPLSPPVKSILSSEEEGNKALPAGCVPGFC